MSNQSYHICYHCKDRTIGCHGKCAAYQEEKAERTKYASIEHKEKAIDRTLARLEHSRRSKRAKR